MSETPPGLYAELADVSLEDPSTFALSVLEVLKQTFNLVAASLLLHTPGEDSLRLRAQIGFRYEDYASFDVPLNYIAGRAVAAGTPLASKEIWGSDSFRDQQHLRESGARSVVAVPLTLTAEAAENAATTVGAPNPIGVLCLYPNDVGETETIRRHAGEFGPFVARLYVASLERAGMELRRKTVAAAAYRRDIGSLAHAFLVLIANEISVETAALWVWDARRDRLYLRRTSHDARPAPPGEMVGLKRDGDSVIAACFSERRTMQLPTSEPENASTQPAGALMGGPENWAAVPVKLPPGTRIRGRLAPSAGVLELANHYTELGGVRHMSRLSWEERFVAEFACELLSVLTYQVLRNQDHESDFERMMHGARTSLQAARSNLQHLDRIEAEKHLPASARNLIPNAIAWLEDLEAQINRDDLVGKSQLSTEPTAVYGDVLAKLEPMVRRMNTRDPARPLHLVGMDQIAANYRSLPIVRANKQALDCVFRNLLDNARKYCRPADGNSPLVHIRALSDSGQRTLVLYVADNGEGIPSQEADLVFEDGFRGELARGLQPQGVGRGLFDCNQLLKRMGGSIALINRSEGGALFRIELPTMPFRLQGR